MTDDQRGGTFDITPDMRVVCRYARHLARSKLAQGDGRDVVVEALDYAIRLIDHAEALSLALHAEGTECQTKNSRAK